MIRLWLIRLNLIFLLKIHSVIAAVRFNLPPTDILTVSILYLILAGCQHSVILCWKLYPSLEEWPVIFSFAIVSFAAKLISLNTCAELVQFSQGG